MRIKTLSLMAFVYCLSLSSSYAQEKLKDNFCIPRWDSKVYLTNDFHSSYPRTVKFECTYECQANGHVEVITGALSVRISSMDDDAKMVVCQGVKVKRVPWGYDYDGYAPFYAYDTNVKKIKAFAFNHISRNNMTEREMLQNLKITLSTVAAHYRATGVPHFLEAADIMFKMSNELPASTKLLDKYVDLLVQKNGISPLEANAQSLVLSSIQGSAGWRIPIHLYK